MRGFKDRAPLAVVVSLRCSGYRLAIPSLYRDSCHREPVCLHADQSKNVATCRIRKPGCAARVGTLGVGYANTVHASALRASTRFARVLGDERRSRARRLWYTCELDKRTALRSCGWVLGLKGTRRRCLSWSPHNSSFLVGADRNTNIPLFCHGHKSTAPALHVCLYPSPLHLHWMYRNFLAPDQVSRSCCGIGVWDTGSCCYRRVRFGVRALLSISRLVSNQCAVAWE